MRRLPSETRQPGMSSTRRCHGCGEQLLPDDGALCHGCRPTLSDAAKVMGAERRRERDEMRNADRTLNNLVHLVRKLRRTVRRVRI